jgi:hypothetical protein
VSKFIPKKFCAQRYWKTAFNSSEECHVNQHSAGIHYDECRSAKCQWAECDGAMRTHSHSLTFTYNSMFKIYNGELLDHIFHTNKNFIFLRDYLTGVQGPML